MLSSVLSTIGVGSFMYSSFVASSSLSVMMFACVSVNVVPPACLDAELESVMH